jgi:ABC-type nitrate/sulfonate/bicarbonate transport system substrate-binding protein
MVRRLRIFFVLLLLACGGAAAAGAAEPVKLSIVIFSPPSVGAILPYVIRDQHFDRANGLDIDFVERTPDAYATEFNSGEFQLGGSASLLIVGLADTRGVKVSYLFNLFDYWGAVVTQRPEIKTLADLKGREIAAAKGTTNYAMFEWFARAQGLDPASLKVVNTAPPGLLGYALADRADAVQLWEPAYSLLLAKKPDIRTLPLDIAGPWHKFAGSDHSPYLGLAAHRDWLAQHRDLVPLLYRTYRQAARWVFANPAAAAPLIAPKADAAGLKAIEALVRDNRRLGMNVTPAGKLKPEIEAVYRAGMSLGLLKTMPDPATIYDGALD